MEKKSIKMYVDLEDLNEYEREHNKINYRRLINRISDGKIWLFNNAPNLSNYDFEFEVNNEYDEETEEYKDIYQYYLIDINNYMLEKLKELNVDDVIIAYSETLAEYVLMVDHFGTSWDYVLTDIEPTNDLDEADL